MQTRSLIRAGNWPTRESPMTLLRTTATAAVLALLIARGSGALAQRSGRATSSTTTARYATVPFELSAESLPRGYLGMDPLQIVTVLKSVKSAKSEFETTEAYNNRISQLLKTPLYGSLTVAHTLAFKIPQTLPPEFDADKGDISLGLPDDNMLFLGKDTDFDLWSYRPVRTVEMSSSSYVASNAFGAKARVLRVRGRVAAVVYKGYCGSAVDEKWSASAADAKAFKNESGILFVGSLIPPFFSSERDVSAPEFTKPVDTDLIVEGIRFEIREIWYYIPSSGHVVHRQPVKENCG